MSSSLSLSSSLSSSQPPPPLLPFSPIDTAPCVSTNPNMHLLEQKEKYVLSHDRGAGAMCTRCDQCPGLELHFWRKMCKACGCRMDVHDIRMEDQWDHAQLVIGRLMDTHQIFENLANLPPTTNGAGAQNASTTVHREVSSPLKLHSLSSSSRNSTADEALPSPPPLPNSEFPPPPPPPPQSPPALQRNNNHVAEKTNVAAPKLSRTQSRYRFRVPASWNGDGDENNHRNDDRALSSTRSEKYTEYAWVPTDNRGILERYMNSFSPQERPIVGTEGETARRQRMASQLPLHDTQSESLRTALSDADRQQHRLFVQTVRRQMGVGELADVATSSTQTDRDNENGDGDDDGASPARIVGPLPCTHCQDTLDVGQLVVTSQHAEPGTAWHPSCFRCAKCEELLVDMIYFHHEGRFYCGRHFADLLYPRCKGCDELIFAVEYTWAEESAWHVQHFCCWRCDAQLGGQRYLLRDEQPVCLECYSRHYAKTCDACHRKVAPDENRVQHSDLTWHADAACFRCFQCSRSLLGAKFMLKEHRLFCSSVCKNEFFDRQNQQQMAIG